MCRHRLLARAQTDDRGAAARMHEGGASMCAAPLRVREGHASRVASLKAMRSRVPWRDEQSALWSSRSITPRFTLSSVEVVTLWGMSGSAGKDALDTRAPGVRTPRHGEGGEGSSLQVDSLGPLFRPGRALTARLASRHYSTRAVPSCSCYMYS